MIDPAIVYVFGVLVLFFFWMYGIVAFLRDVKNRLVPAYRQWRRDDDERPTTTADSEQRYVDGDHSSDARGPSRSIDE